MEYMYFFSSHRGDTDPEKLLEDPVVADIATKHKRSPAQVNLGGFTFHVV